MRHTREAIHQFLELQASGGQTVATFCAENSLKVPTFYCWKKKYGTADPVEPSGFCELTPLREVSKRKLCLPSGLQLEITGLSTREIAELVVEIERAHV
jgi:hypothetical protein